MPIIPLSMCSPHVYYTAVNVFNLFVVYQHLSKVIEVSRVHLFDIITQYRAIFTDDDHVTRSADLDTLPRESLLLQSWVQCKVSGHLIVMDGTVNFTMSYVLLATRI